MSQVWRVELPRGAEPPYRVFVNGIPQKEGDDYRVVSGELHFPRELKKEGKLGFWRWTSLFLGMVGTYRQNDSVDVHWTTPSGDHKVAVYLDIEHEEP
jgi:hypothetical protein